MTDQEYRQDDTDDGYCPQCGEPLSGLTTAARGYCDRHGWVWADWRSTAGGTGLAEDDFDEDRFPITDDEGDDAA